MRFPLRASDETGCSSAVRIAIDQNSTSSTRQSKSVVHLETTVAQRAHSLIPLPALHSRRFHREKQNYHLDWRQRQRVSTVRPPQRLAHPPERDNHRPADLRKSVPR